MEKAHGTLRVVVPSMAFLIKAQLLPKTGGATLNLFLETVFFTPGAA
jgi:hypothetical protein